MVNGPQEIILEHLRAIRANKGLKEGHRNLKAELIAVEENTFMQCKAISFVGRLSRVFSSSSTVSEPA
jgi:hypothetical protein